MEIETEQEIIDSYSLAKNIIHALEEQEIPTKLGQYGLGRAWFALCKVRGLSRKDAIEIVNFMANIDEHE